MNFNLSFLNKIEKIKDRALAATIEKNSFLGEYKERVLAALTFDEVNEKGIYNEIFYPKTIYIIATDYTIPHTNNGLSSSLTL